MLSAVNPLPLCVDLRARLNCGHYRRGSYFYVSGLFKERPCALPIVNRLLPLFSLRTRHCSSSIQECQSESPKCFWQNQRLHRSQYLVKMPSFSE